MVIENEIPAVRRIPCAPKLMFAMPDAAIGMVRNGTDVPGDGAVVRLNTLRNAAAAPTLDAVTL